MAQKNIALIASRLRCVDAISVEAEKWIEKYVQLGYTVHLIAGKFGEPVHYDHLEIPEMDYKHPEVRGIKSIMFGTKLEKPGKKAAEILLSSMVTRIRNPLKNYLVSKKIDLISVEDSLISLKNLPLNLALSGVIKDLGIPTVSRYHYLPWQNSYFTKNDNFPKLISDLPFNGRNVIHITSTESAKSQLSDKTEKRINAKVIPNTIDLDKLSKEDSYNADFRKAFGISDDALIFLQPTRIKNNKGVEKSIRIVSEINSVTKKDNVLMITGSPVYQRGNYFEAIVKRIKKQNINVIFANDRIFLARHQNKETKFYSIGDAYLHADFVLYPNTSDAFGNPVIEACAYKKPLIVNTYPNLKEIMDKGFSFIVMDGKPTQETISDIYELILNKEKRLEMAEKNYSLVKEHFSTDKLDDTLVPLLNTLEGEVGFITKITGKIFHWKEKEKFKAEYHRQENKRVKSLVNRKGGYKEPSVKKS